MTLRAGDLLLAGFLLSLLILKAMKGMYAMNLQKALFDQAPHGGKSRREKVLNLFIAFAMYLMVAFVFVNAVLRYCANSGWPVSEELSRWLFVWVSMLGSVVAYQEGRHVGVDLLITRLAPKPRKVVTIIGEIVVLAVLLIMLWGSLLLFRKDYNVLAPACRLPTGILSSSLIVCSVSMTWICIRNLIRDIRKPICEYAAQREADDLAQGKEGNS